MASATKLPFYLLLFIFPTSTKFSELFTVNNCSKNNIFKKYFAEGLHSEQLCQCVPEKQTTSHYYTETGLPKILEKQLNKEQKIAVKQLENAVDEFMHSHYDNVHLLVLLTVFSFDVQKSEMAIRKYFKLMHNVGAEDILNSNYEVPELAAKYIPALVFWGFTEDGSPVVSAFLGRIDVRGLIRSFSYYEAAIFLFYVFESLMEIIREYVIKTGKIGFLIAIADYKDVDYYQYMDLTAIQKCQTVASTSFAYEWPNPMKLSYNINMPYFVVALTYLAEPFMREEDWKKTKFYGSDGWQEDILQNIDRKIVPTYYGGDHNITRLHDLFSEKLELIPEERYIEDDLYLKSSDPEVKTIVVRASEIFDHVIKVQNTGTVIKWIFQTREYNIQFGVLFKVTKENETKFDLVQLVKLEFVDSHLLPEKGELQCDKFGEYILRFDNTQSWFRGKELLLKVEVIESPVPNSS